MKRLIFIILVLCLFAVTVSAKPFVVCGPPDVPPDYYILTMDNGDEVQTPYPLHYDLEDILSGEHIVSARAFYSLWGVSESSVPLEFIKPSLSAPSTQLAPE